MECPGVQDNPNSGSDDFLTEFLNLDQEDKGMPNRQPKSAASHPGCNNVTAGCFSRLNVEPTSSGNFILDLGIGSTDVAFTNEDTGISSEVDNMKPFPSSSKTDPIISILSEPVISTIDNACISFCSDEREDDISRTVSAELEKVLSTPGAFEDIGLYLECSEDDIQSIQKDTAKQNVFGAGNFSLHAGNSSIQSDVSLKISFPAILDETEEIKRCSACKLSFSSEAELLGHLDSSNCEVLVCKDCAYNTKSIKRFLTHMERRHSVFGIRKIVDSFKNSYGQVQDKLCSLNNIQCCTFDNTKLIPKEHVEEAIENNPDHSSLSFTESDRSDINKEKVNRTYPSYPCSFCPYTGKSPKLLKMHTQNLHSPNRSLYKCKVCEFTCLQKRTLDGHSKSHESSYLFDCPECKQQYVTLSALKRHSKTHRTERDFVCIICSKGFKIKNTLTDHMKKVHNTGSVISSEMNKCSEQNRVLNVSKSSQLGIVAIGTCISAQAAIETDVNQSNIVGLCTNPDRIVKQQFNENETPVDENSGDTCLESQSTKENSHNCDVLGRKERNDTNKQTEQVASQEHLKTNDKRFTCSWPECGRRFRDNFNLNSHYSRHTDSKTLSCPNCDFKCIQKGHLNYHLRTKHAKKNIVVSKAPQKVVRAIDLV